MFSLVEAFLFVIVHRDGVCSLSDGVCSLL